MNQQNPYAAPQTEKAVAAIQYDVLDRPQDLQPLIQGAGYCYDAFTTIYCTPVILLLLCIPFSSETVISYLLGILLLYAAVLHLLGLTKLVQVPMESYARGLFVFALISFGCSMIASLGLYAMIWTGKIGEVTLWLSLGNMVILFCSFASQLWGISQVSAFVNRDDISRLARLSLGCYAIFMLRHLVVVTAHPLLKFFIICSWLVAAVLGLVFYGMALRRIMKLSPTAPLIDARLALVFPAYASPQNNEAGSAGGATFST